MFPMRWPHSRCRHAAGPAGDASFGEQSGQQERSQVIVLEGALVAVRGRAAPSDQTARVVGEDVDAAVLLQQVAGQRADVVQPVVVGEERRSADRARDLLRAVGISADDRDVPALLREFTCRYRPESRACTRS